MRTEFKTNDLVWAKMRYSPAWPAKVIDPPAGKHRKKCYYVFFFGTENVGWVKKSDVCSYEMNYRGKFQPGILHQTYTKAVKKIGKIYHEELQLKSPAFQGIQLAELAENGEEPVHVPEANDEQDFNLMEVGELWNKIEEMLNIRMMNNYKKIIPKEAVVLLQKCDAALPALTSNAVKLPSTEFPPDEPPF